MKYKILFIPALILVLTNISNAGPSIGYIYPAGGRQGETFSITIGGQELKDVKDIHISGKGIKITNMIYTEDIEVTFGHQRNICSIIQGLIGQTNKKIDPKFNKIAENLHKYTLMTDQKLKKELETEEKELSELRKIVKAPKRQPNVQIAEQLKIELIVDKNAAPGIREVRVLSPNGISNPLNFYINNLSEISEEQEENPYIKKKDLVLETGSLPVIINGRIMPGEEDQYSFQAQKGQSLVFIVKARALIPYLADAVPGWFQAVLTICQPTGEELAYMDDYKFDPDPILFFKAPKDGKYILKIRDSIYRGREDFVYRIFIGENLLTADKSKPSPFGINSLPEKSEKEPNNDLKNSQLLKLPFIINGRIEQQGDIDIYSFTGKAGQMIVCETVSRRLNSPLDSFITLMGSNGKILATNDDFSDKAFGLITHQADSYFTNRIPYTGKYYITIEDIQNKGGDDYVYRLRVSDPRPDFDLRIVPSEISIPQGGTGILTAHALRKDGFKGDIKLSLKNNSSGISLNNSVIPGKEDKIKLTVTASEEINLGHHKLEIEGTAQIENKDVKHAAIPSEDMMQAFAYRHLVPCEELFMLITKKSPISIYADLPEGEVLKIPADGEVKLVIKSVVGKGSPFFKNINKKNTKESASFFLELDDPLKGFIMKEQEIDIKEGRAIVLIHADREDLKPGTKGYLIINLLTGKGKKAQGKNRKIISTAPAISFEITE